MPIVKTSTSYNTIHAKLVKKNSLLEKKIIKAFRFFQTNPHHPSLHTEKLKNSIVWSIRVDQGNRLFFIWNDDQSVATFFFLGPHDSYRTIDK